MAENEWYDKYKKDVTAALTKGKAVPRDNAVPCALVKAHDGTFLVLAHVAAAKQTAMVQMAKSKGAKVVSTGILYLGDQAASFEVTDGDALVQQKFSAAAIEATGKPMKVHVFAAQAPADGAPPPAAPEAPPAGGTLAAFTARAQAVAQAVARADAKAQEVLKPRLTHAVVLARSGEFAKANAGLDLVEKALAAASARTETPPPAPPAEPAAHTAPADKAQFTKRLQDVKERYAAVLKAGPPNQAALEKAMGLVVAAARENDFARGLRVLGALDRALKATPAPGESSTAAETPPRPGPETPPEPTTAPEQPPTSSSPTPDTSPQAPTTDTLETWVAALDAARNSLGRLEDKLAATDEDEAADVADAGFDDLLDDLDGGLTDALGDFDAVRHGDRESAAKKVAELVGKQRRLLLGDELVGELDANPFGVKIGLRDALGRALDEVEKELKA